MSHMKEVALGNRSGASKTKSYSTFKFPKRYDLTVPKKRKKKDDRTWIHVVLPPEDEWIFASIKAIAESKDRSVSYCAREALEAYINKNPAPQADDIIKTSVKRELQSP